MIFHIRKVEADKEFGQSSYNRTQHSNFEVQGMNTGGSKDCAQEITQIILRHYRLQFSSHIQDLAKFQNYIPKVYSILKSHQVQ